jgi:hypothetical protein
LQSWHLQKMLSRILKTCHIDTMNRLTLPMTETGYRSHFCAPADINAEGGPAEFVLAWLECEAKSPAWLAAQEARRQLPLF